jgi:hypothetical protein
MSLPGMVVDDPIDSRQKENALSLSKYPKCVEMKAFIPPSFDAAHSL